ncbi:MAG: hypothetical protein ACJATI_001046 [Halioglobus sp.]|jgi:hypothetical protein
MKTANQIILSLVLLIVNTVFINGQTLIPINTDGTGSNPSDLHVFDEKLYFIGSDENNTNVVFSIFNEDDPEIVNDSPEFISYGELTVLPSSLVFTGDSGLGKKAFMVSNLANEVLEITGDYYDPSDFIEHDGVIYFAAKNADDRYAIYKIDNSTAFQLGDIDHQYIRTKEPYGAPNSQKNILVANNKLCYLTTEGVFYIDLADTDETYFVVNSDAYTYSYTGGDYTNYQIGDYIFFQEGIVSNSELLKVDFALPSPQIERIDLNPTKSSLPRHFIEFEGYMFFTAIVGLFDQLVWYYNPITGLYKHDIINNKSSGSMGFADDDPFYAFDNRLFFYDHEIVINADGTPEILDDILCAPNQSITRELLSLDDQYYYIGRTPGSDFIYDIYSCDENNQIVQETCLINGHTGIYSFAKYNDRIYISSAVVPAEINELFKWPEDPGNGLCQDIINITNVPLTNNLLAYPNPVSKDLWIQSTENEISSIEIFNAIGIKIDSYRIDYKDSNRCRLSMVSFPKGIYFLKVFNQASHFELIKVIVE